MERHRKDIGLKITSTVAAATLVFLVVSVGLSYFCLFDSSRNDTMSSRVNIAKLMAGSIADTIDSQAGLIKINASAGVLKEAVEASNVKYQGMDAEAARRYILDINSKWLKSAGDQPFIQEYLANKASLFLKSNTKQKSGFFDILAADKYGALVGASYKGLSFYCADENWFKEIFTGSKTRMSFTEAIFDETSGKWAFPMACAIEDDRGEAIGAYKALVDISVFSKPLEGFGAGKRGKAALIDGRGYLIFYPGVKPFTNKFCEYNELKKLLSDTRGYSVIDTAYMGKGKTAVAFSPVTSPMLSGKGVRLYIVVSESSVELFSPLNKLALKMVVFSMILALLVLIAAWAVFKGLFTDPVRKLIDGMKRLGEGKLYSMVDIKTGDEMEDLATALNNAAQSLSHITTSIKTLDKEKLECKITRQRFEKENLGFLSLMLQFHGLLLDINKGVETARQEASRSQNEKQKMEFELLHSRSAGLIKALEKDIYASKLETGSLEFSMKPNDLRDIIKESVFAFEPKVREKGLDLRLDIPKSALTAQIDKDKIKQVFDILIDNSLMATEKGYIAISVTQIKDGIGCSVSDTGTAIPKESIGDVFDRCSGFSRTPSQKGSLADPSLYIVKRIIEKHDGKFRVESEPGRQTSFIFTLPSSSAILK